MYPQATHTGASSLFLPLSRSLSRARAFSLLLYISFPLSLSLPCYFFLAPFLLFSRSARFSSFSFSSPLCPFFSMFDHQRHVRRTNACNIPGSGAKWKDILFVPLSFPSRAASSLYPTHGCTLADCPRRVGCHQRERSVDRTTIIAGSSRRTSEEHRSVAAPLDQRCANASAHKRSNSGLRCARPGAFALRASMRAYLLLDVRFSESSQKLAILGKREKNGSKRIRIMRNNN